MLLEAEREAARAHLAVEAATERLKRHKAAQAGAPPASCCWPRTLFDEGLVHRTVWPSAHPPGVQLVQHEFQAHGPKRAVCLLLHGFAVHPPFELQRWDAEMRATSWEGSLLQLLTAQGILCYTLDQQGHGQSGGARGLRGFAEDASDYMRDALELRLRAVAANPGLPVFWVGISMGGSVALQAVEHAPHPEDSVVLLAPALAFYPLRRPCWAGPALQALQAAAAISPAWAAIPSSLPAGTPRHILAAAATIAAARDRDSLSYSGRARAGPLLSFLRVAERLRAEGALEAVRVKALLAVHSTLDPTAHPHGSTMVYQRCASDDKTLALIGSAEEGSAHRGQLRTNFGGAETVVWAEAAAGHMPSSCAATPSAAELCLGLLSLGIGHGVTLEPGADKVFAAVAAWIVERCSTPSV